MTKTIAQAAVYVAFFALIGTAMFITKSAMPLWALLLMPNKLKDTAKDKANKIQ